MATTDCHEMMRLGYGKVTSPFVMNLFSRVIIDIALQLRLKTNSKLLPDEITMKLGEQFECYLNNLGKALVRTLSF